MNKLILLLLLSLTFAPQAIQAQPVEWLTLGQNDYSEGYKTLYRLKLEVPKGVHDAYDIKKGMQVMRFKLTWLPPVTQQSDVHSHFKNLLEATFKSPEDLKFNQITLTRFYTKLPEAQRHDEWLFEYSPQTGTKILIKGKKIHSLIGSEANDALIQAWLHKSPVVTAKLMKRLLKAQK
ncbi:chalcone isomerase family protein [Marinicella rhabdoformis]|uniref:chalcone isomerase family protein n=1 Tax=Marinicella rhabdoformis TaxID=2580566 RepID=UPI0012AEB3C9|nr:chalcone isomerase family protein [Marinicella rhabdoformis]